MNGLNAISAVIICYNEEEKIERALSSLLGVADEVVVVDSGSQDRTLEICRRYTDRVFQRPWSGYRSQKQFACDLAHHDWILSLDADEELSPELKDEIVGWKALDSVPYGGYQIPRLSFFLGRWIRHTTWYPDWQLRLFRKSRGSWQGGRLHESFKVEGTTGQLRGHLLHYSYSSVSEFIEQLDRFSSLAAEDLRDRGVRAGVGRLLFDPTLVFLRNYVLTAGFLDGIPGFAVSVLASVSTFFKYLKLHELTQLGQQAERPDGKA